MLALLLLAPVLATAAASPCESGRYYIESTGKCVAEEECLTQWRHLREGGYCREVYEVSTETELLRIGDHPYEAYVLTQDVVLTKPWGPTEFWGELDGQGHWIKNISFDLQAFYAAHDPKLGLYVGIFPNVTVLKNLGLEAAVNITNVTDECAFFYLGLVSGYTYRPLLVHDVIVNGSISMQGHLRYDSNMYQGGLFGYQAFEDAVIGPNVTSYCALGCKADYFCYVGGIAGVAYANVTSLAAVINSVSLDARHIRFGGIVGWSHSQFITESFAEVGNVSVTPRVRELKLGGLVGEYGGEVVQDCYAIVHNITAEANTTSSATIYVSAFIAAICTDRLRIIERCYGLLTDAVTTSGQDCGVYIGGLIADSWISNVSISSSFAIIEDIRAANSRYSHVGGFIGHSTSWDEDNGLVTIKNSWAQLTISSSLEAKNVYLGGICGYQLTDLGNIILKDVSITLTLTSEALDLQQKAIGVLVGQMSTAEATGILVEYHCLNEASEECTAVPLVALGGSMTISDVYVVQEGGEVTSGNTTGEFNIVTGEYATGSYPGIQDWTFYKNAYPTLSTLPVVDRTGDSMLSNPEGSAWSA